MCTQALTADQLPVTQLPNFLWIKPEAYNLGYISASDWTHNIYKKLQTLVRSYDLLDNPKDSYSTYSLKIKIFVSFT